MLLSFLLTKKLTKEISTTLITSLTLFVIHMKECLQCVRKSKAIESPLWLRTIGFLSL